MGNASGKKDGKDGSPMSPSKESFGKKVFIQQPSLDESLDLMAGEFKQLMREGSPDEQRRGRPRASTVLETPQLNSQALPVVFRWEGGGRNISIAGTFNNWQTKIPMNKSTNNFTAILDLPEGEYEYKFFVDGAWQHSTKQNTKTNPYGTINNVVKVQKSDFEVFEALAIDSSTAKNKDYSSGSPPGEYSQEIPPREVQERTAGPPILPPHLLQVILNKDIGPQYEPALLPEPNHVMLNHLYALSIKDGVMVLSATHRYRKKYVTSLLYKPL